MLNHFKSHPMLDVRQRSRLFTEERGNTRPADTDQHLAVIQLGPGNLLTSTVCSRWKKSPKKQKKTLDVTTHHKQNPFINYNNHLELMELMDGMAEYMRATLNRLPEDGAELVKHLMAMKVVANDPSKYGIPTECLILTAERALRWMQDLCCEPNEWRVGGPASLAEETAKTPAEREMAQRSLAKNFERAGIKEGFGLMMLMRTLLETLTAVDSEAGIAALPKLWFNTAIRCLRCVGAFPIRHMGLQLLQEAHTVALNRAITSTRLGTELHMLIGSQAGVVAFLVSLLGEGYAHTSLIVAAAPWVVQEYYKQYCYEDDTEDIMVYLVAAAVHPEWGASFAATNLLVEITIANISIISLNSLCYLMKETVRSKATATAGNRLILTWIDKTRVKKWVIVVQERVLNLLYSMLVNTPSENTEDTAKILDYFKTQFGNIRSYMNPDLEIHIEATPWTTSKKLLARTCVLTCTQDCLLEIQRCRDLEEADAPCCDLDAAEARSRAAQAASFLAVITDHVGNLMHVACEAGGLHIVRRLFLLSAADDIRVQNSRGETPLCLACKEGHLDVAKWLVLQGAAGHTDDGHVDSEVLLGDVPQRDVPVLRDSLDFCIRDHRAFVSVVLAAIGSRATLAPPAPLASHAQKGKARAKSKQKAKSPGSLSSPSDLASGCTLTMLRGHEKTLLILIADFAGMVRGRQLRNAREALQAIDAMSTAAETAAVEAAGAGEAAGAAEVAE